MKTPPTHKPSVIIKAQRKKESRRNRGNSYQRGYDREWQGYRLWFLKLNPLCLYCQKSATEIDHIKPLQGRDDPGRFDEHNLRPVCKRCHSRISNNYKRTGVNEMPGDDEVLGE